ncbi:hypothetical protein ACS0TY_007070 [Phlomoides rotata]
MVEIISYVFPTLISLFLIWSIMKSLSKPSGNKKSPPSPPKLPILGNLHQLGSLTHRSLQSLALKHGPLMLLHFGSVPVLVISSADAARDITKTHDIAFADRPRHKVIKRLTYDCRTIAFLPYDETWKKLRSIFVLQLLSNKRVQSFRSIREEETAILVKKIGESSGDVNLSVMLAEFPHGLICRSAFGTKFQKSGKGKKLVLLLTELMGLIGVVSIGDFIPWLSWLNRVSGLDGRLDRVAKEMDDFLEDVIQERMEYKEEIEDNEENFVDIMLQIQKENSADVSIRRESIKAIILDAFLGGTETISTALEWAMAELLRNPKVMEKLRTEVREIVNDKNEITDDDLGKMHYLKTVIKETLRCHPPIPVTARVVRKDVKIKECNISKGTLTLINIWAIERDPITWEEPEKFWPERFLNSSIDFTGSNFEFIPFGAGRRGCPGMTYGVATIELLLANLVLKFNWKLPNGAEGKDLDMSEIPGLTVHRAVPLLAVATETT